MKILISDDDPVSREVLKSMIQEMKFEYVTAEDGEQAWKILSGDDPPGIAILDWMMPEYTGVELCRKIRAMDENRYIYIILLTSRNEREDIIEGLQAGADDYITKPFFPEELQCRVRTGARIVTLERKLNLIASTDPLTGVLNRRSFMIRLKQEMERSKRTKTPLGIVLADIDFFKKVNDNYGHQFGDKVLQVFARSIHDSCRLYDFLGRYGGEEFIACCPDCNVEETFFVAKRFQENISKLAFPVKSSGEIVRITASFGVSSLGGRYDINMDTLIRMADEALYTAKRTGRNRVLASTNLQVENNHISDCSARKPAVQADPRVLLYSEQRLSE